jgi:hypothetical protein
MGLGARSNRNNFRGDQQTIRNNAGIMAIEAGKLKWGSMVRPFASLGSNPCICDLTRLPKADYQDERGCCLVSCKHTFT